MAFAWRTLKETIQDQLQLLAEEKISMIEFQIGEKRYKSRPISEWKELIALCDTQISMADESSSRVTFGSMGDF